MDPDFTPHDPPGAPHAVQKSHLSTLCWEALLSATSLWLVSSRSRAVMSSCSYTFACCSFICRSRSTCLLRYCKRRRSRVTRLRHPKCSQHRWAQSHKTAATSDASSKSRGPPVLPASGQNRLSGSAIHWDAQRPRERLRVQFARLFTKAPSQEQRGEERQTAGGCPRQTHHPPGHCELVTSARLITAPGAPTRSPVPAPSPEAGGWADRSKPLITWPVLSGNQSPSCHSGNSKGLRSSVLGTGDKEQKYNFYYTTRPQVYFMKRTTLNPN